MRNALLAPLPEGYDFFALTERRNPGSLDPVPTETQEGVPPTQLEGRTEESLIQDLISVPGLEGARKGTLPIGLGNVPAILERVKGFPLITKFLKQSPNLMNKVGKFTSKGLKLLEQKLTKLAGTTGFNFLK